MTPDLEFVLRQQEEIGALLRAGHPEQFGLRMAASDWIAEEVILSGPD